MPRLVNQIGNIPLNSDQTITFCYTTRLADSRAHKNYALILIFLKREKNIYSNGPVAVMVILLLGFTTANLFFQND